MKKIFALFLLCVPLCVNGQILDIASGLLDIVANIDVVNKGLESLGIDNISEKSYRTTMIARATEQLARAEDQLKETQNLVQGIRNTALATQNIKQGVEQMWQWQIDLQKDIRALISVKDLRWADVLYLSGRAMRVSTNPSDYIPYLSKEAPLIKYLENPQSYDKTDNYRLYKLFGPTVDDWMDKKLDLDQRKSFMDHASLSEIESSLKLLSQEYETNYQNILTLSEREKIVMLQTSNEYKRLADSLVLDAQDLQKQIQLGNFSLDQGQQIEIANMARLNIERAMEYKLKYVEMEKLISTKSDPESYYQYINLKYLKKKYEIESFYMYYFGYDKNH